MSTLPFPVDRVCVRVCACACEVGYLFHSTSHPYKVMWRFNAFKTIYFVFILRKCVKKKSVELYRILKLNKKSSLNLKVLSDFFLLSYLVLLVFEWVSRIAFQSPKRSLT